MLENLVNVKEADRVLMVRNREVEPDVETGNVKIGCCEIYSTGNVKEPDWP